MADTEKSIFVQIADKIKSLIEDRSIKIVELYIDTNDSNRKKLCLLDKNGNRTNTFYTKFSEFVNLVEKGLIRIKYIAAGDNETGRKALYTAHLVDNKDEPTDGAIRFDATGMLGNLCYTRSISITETESDGMDIQINTIKEVVLKTNNYYTFKNVSANNNVYTCDSSVINVINLPTSGTFTIKFPNDIDTLHNKAREFVIRLKGNNAQIIIDSTNIDKIYGDTIPTTLDNNEYIIFVTEIAYKEWLIKVEELFQV